VWLNTSVQELILKLFYLKHGIMF